MKNYQLGGQHQNPALRTVGKFSKKISHFSLIAALAAASIFASCKKDTAEAPDGGLKLKNAKALAPTAGGAALNLTNASGTVALSATGGIYTLTNYFVDQGIYTHPDSVYHRPNGTYYFDFSENDNIKGATATTPPSNSDWDLSFSGTANAYIKKNSTATFRYKDLAFASVVLSDWSTAVTPTIPAGGFGHNAMIMPPTAPHTNPGSGTTGWFNYWFANHQVLPITNRTLLVKDESGNVYAVEFVSVYENGTPVAIPPSAYPNNYSKLQLKYKYLGSI